MEPFDGKLVERRKQKNNVCLHKFLFVKLMSAGRVPCCPPAADAHDYARRLSVRPVICRLWCASA